jgi:hypothetical protein
MDSPTRFKERGELNGYMSASPFFKLRRTFIRFLDSVFYGIIQGNIAQFFYLFFLVGSYPKCQSYKEKEEN